MGASLGERRRRNPHHDYWTQARGEAQMGRASQRTEVTMEAQRAHNRPGRACVGVWCSCVSTGDGG